MEHRLCDRVESTIPAFVGTVSGVYARGTIRDVGIGGLFLDVPQKFRRNAYVTVTASLADERGEPRTVRFQGFVTHVQPKGLGMMFSIIDDEVLAALHELLGAEKVEEDLTHLRTRVESHWLLDAGGETG